MNNISDDVLFKVLSWIGDLCELCQDGTGLIYVSKQFWKFSQLKFKHPNINKNFDKLTLSQIFHHKKFGFGLFIKHIPSIDIYIKGLLFKTKIKN